MVGGPENEARVGLASVPGSEPETEARVGLASVPGSEPETEARVGPTMSLGIA